MLAQNPEQQTNAYDLQKQKEKEQKNLTSGLFRVLFPIPSLMYSQTPIPISTPHKMNPFHTLAGHLHPRINLHNAILGHISSPVRARTIDSRHIHQREHLRLTLEKLECESFGCVPCGA